MRKSELERWKDFLIIKYTRNFQVRHFSEKLVVERRNFILISRLTLVQNVIFWVEVPLIQKCLLYLQESQ